MLNYSFREAKDQGSMNVMLFLHLLGSINVKLRSDIISFPSVYKYWPEQLTVSGEITKKIA